eukprot:142440-Pleurochrysis_carterae.AAC.4
MELAGPTARLLSLLGVDAKPEPFVAILRAHLSNDGISQHGAAISARRCAEKARTPEDAAAFTALHTELRNRGVRELDRFTLLLQKVGEERALAEMLRTGHDATAADASHDDTKNDEGTLHTISAASHQKLQVTKSILAKHGRTSNAPVKRWDPNDDSWLLARQHLSGRHLHHALPEGCLLYTSPSPRDGLLS